MKIKRDIFLFFFFAFFYKKGAIFKIMRQFFLAVYKNELRLFYIFIRVKPKLAEEEEKKK